MQASGEMLATLGALRREIDLGQQQPVAQVVHERADNIQDVIIELDVQIERVELLDMDDRMTIIQLQRGGEQLDRTVQVGDDLGASGVFQERNCRELDCRHRSEVERHGLVAETELVVDVSHRAECRHVAAERFVERAGLNCIHNCHYVLPFGLWRRLSASIITL